MTIWLTNRTDCTCVSSYSDFQPTAHPPVTLPFFHPASPLVKCRR